MVAVVKGSNKTPNFLYYLSCKDRVLSPSIHDQEKIYSSKKYTYKNDSHIIDKFRVLRQN